MLFVSSDLLDGLQETELLTAGFPCIDVSRAGLRAGLHGKVILVQPYRSLQFATLQHATVAYFLCTALSVCTKLCSCTVYTVRHSLCIAVTYTWGCEYAPFAVETGACCL